MSKLNLLFAPLFLLLFVNSSSLPSLEDLTKDDQFLWLEQRSNPQVDKWVNSRNAETNATYTKLNSFKKNLEIMKDINLKSERLPKIQIFGDFYYTIYKPNSNSRGIWKRAPISNSKIKIENWETVLDLDKLNKKLNKKYVIIEIQCLLPKSIKCLLYLSDSGGDSSEIFEFDTSAKDFVKNGFYLPNAKNTAAWVDADHIAVTSGFGNNKVLQSGFGKELRVIGRDSKNETGIILATAPDEYLAFYFMSYQLGKDQFVTLALRYYSETQFDLWVISPDAATKVDLPEAAWVYGIYNGYAVGLLKSDWNYKGKSFLAGDLIGAPVNSPNKKNREDIVSFFRPDTGSSINSVKVTKDFIFVEMIKNVRSNIFLLRSSNKANSRYDLHQLTNTNSLLSDIDYAGNRAIFSSEDFLQPESIVIFDGKTGKMETLSQDRSAFSIDGMVVEQRWTKSKDGTKVPYFLVGKKDVIKKGNAPLIATGYGGYGISYLPEYDKYIGKLWLQKGGLFVVATVRGGGEFGTEWYQSALRENKHKAFEDFSAISSNIISSGLTSPDKFGIYGGSFGSLLVGAAMVRNPEYYRAVFSYVPVFDILRGEVLLEGANWRGEFGDPKEEKYRRAILDYSPYQNIKKGVSYPAFMTYSSRTDERTHPGNGRKMIAKLKLYNNSNAFYFETFEGGHSGSSTDDQSIFWHTLMMEFFSRNLGLDGKR